MRSVEAILRNQDTVLSVSTYLDGLYGIEDVYISLPSVIGRSGITRTMNLVLDDKELTGLQSSANILSEIISQVGLL